MEPDTNSLKTSIIEYIRKIVYIYSPYALIYMVIRCLQGIRNFHETRLRILGKRSRDGREHNLPVSSEVVGLIVGDFNAAGFERDVIVKTHFGLFKWHY